MKAVCGRCKIEFSLEEYESNRFCRQCGSLLKLQSSPDVKRSPKGLGTSTLDFEFDVELATSVGKRLNDGFQNKTGYFQGHIMPEYILPPIEEGSKELALYYTYVIAIDYQTNAHKLWRNSREQYQHYPEMFDPQEILKTPDLRLIEFVRSLGARYPSNGAKAWKKISQILLKQYKGDPRNITPTPTHSNELWRRMDKFPYLRGKKIGTLYLRVMGDLELFKISNLETLDVAVDLQVSRFTFYTGALKPLRALNSCVTDPPVRPAVEKLWRLAAQQVDCAPWHLDQPIWVLASNQCTRQFCGPCPVNDLCEKRFDVQVQNNYVTYFP